MKKTGSLKIILSLSLWLCLFVEPVQADNQLDCEKYWNTLSDPQIGNIFSEDKDSFQNLKMLHTSFMQKCGDAAYGPSKGTSSAVASALLDVSKEVVADCLKIKKGEFSNLCRKYQDAFDSAIKQFYPPDAHPIKTKPLKTEQ
jgi:hypothetical protein